MELYTKNFHELPGAEIELRGNIVLLKFIIALLATKPPKNLGGKKNSLFVFSKTLSIIKPVMFGDVSGK